MYVNFILLLIINQNNELLLLRRINTPFCNGCYCLPGREIRYGESASQAATAEIAESLALKNTITPQDCVHIMHRKCNDPEFFATVFKVQLSDEQPVRLLQPDRYDAMLWASFENLPPNMVPAHHYALEQIKNRNTYSEHGWQKS
jgi:ADP-ribose pyrophosphatase YjhB (NUDIX family)